MRLAWYDLQLFIYRHFHFIFPNKEGSVMLQLIYETPITVSRTTHMRDDAAFQFFAAPLKKARMKLAFATARVTEIVREFDPHFYPERGSVWFNYDLISPLYTFHVMDRTKNRFPNNDFERMCRFNCLEKTIRTITDGLACSHQNRDPKNMKWGGSARLEIDFVGERRHASVIIVGACSGRKEWEDLAIVLGTYHHVGLVHFDDPQVQQILRIADASVINDPDCRPRDMTIREYTQEIFSQIEARPTLL